MPKENSLQKQYHAEPTDRSLSRQFDSRATSAFCERSVSEETRRAYRRVTREFFRFTGPRHPAEITSQDVQRWRDQLISQKKSAPRQSPLSSPLCARSSIIFRLEGTSVITRRSLSWCRRPLSRKICAGGHSRRKRCVTC
ncbi:MAG: hypothetical protein DMF64_11540 [Acidobacteria bacterium]|nr:MAG: hypothetical protein DMF64_11540 [Acidobacteriota bacterium]